jgi:hypothetical protein
MSNLNAVAYENAAQLYFKQNPRDFEKYFSPTLLATVVAEMQSSLPSVVAARLAFQRLVANGRLQRTDGKTHDDDRAEARAAAQANIDKVAEEVDAPPLTAAELDHFASLSQQELSRLYYGEDDDAINDFAVRYRKANREHMFRIPERFQKIQAPASEPGAIELTAEQYNAMTAAELQRKIRDPRWKAAVYRLIAEHKI